MFQPTWQCRLSLLLLIGAFGVPSPAHGQKPDQFAELAVGFSSYDLSGTGTTLAVGAGAGFRLAGPLFLTPGMTYFHYSPQGSEDVTYLFPELSLQLQAQLGAIQPYLGLGGGRAFQVSGPEPRVHEWTLHAAGGIRLSLTPAWGMGSQFRLRAVQPFHGSMVDVTAGVVRWF
jgi:hypothetical protein